MTKHDLAHTIVEVVVRSNSDQQALEHVHNLLDTLEPKNKESFAKWGQGKQRVDPDECWDD